MKEVCVCMYTHTSSGSPTVRMSQFDTDNKNSTFFSAQQTLIGSREKESEAEENK